MSITSHDVPNYEQLLDYVPRNRYDKQAITTSRRETQISATGNNLVQENKFPSTATVNFLIPPSTSTLLNLSECYFDIEGRIRANKTGNKTTDSLPKFSKFWILRAIQNATLKVAGTNIYSITNPAKYAKFKEMMYYDYVDIKRGNEELNGLPCDVFRQADGIDNTKTYEAYVVKSTAATDEIIAKSGDPAAFNGKMNDNWEEKTFLLGEALSSSKIKELPIEIKAPNNNSYYTIWWIKNTDNTYTHLGFYVHLKLTDLFPIENLKPIFGQQVEIELKTESEGYCGIKLTNALSNQVDGDCGKITEFKKFRLNSVNYQLNIKMIEKLQQIYSKQIVEIIDDYSEYPQQMLGVESRGTLNVKLPLSINFESDMLYISWPESTGNPEREDVKPPTTDSVANKQLNYWNHTPLENRFMNIQRIEITCDSEIIYSHNYIHDGGIDSGNAADIYKIIGYKQKESSGSYVDDYVPIGNFLDAYELYKQCRFYCGQSDHGAMSFEEFLTSGFAICLPMSAFSRLSTGSMIELNITFGDGIVKTGKSTHIAGINQKWLGSENVIDTISIIQKSKKAIVFNGYNNCQVKQINQSFEQDIDISEPTPENGAQQ